MHRKNKKIEEQLAISKVAKCRLTITSYASQDTNIQLAASQQKIYFVSGHFSI